LFKISLYLSSITLLWEVTSWDMGHWGSLAGSNVLLCWHRLSGLLSKGWVRRRKGTCFVYHCKQITEVYGYILFDWLLYPQCYVTLLTSNFLKF
jgi:hypothetical protein